MKEAMSHTWDLRAPAQKTTVDADVWEDGKGGGTVSPLNLNPVIPGKEMLIT